MPRATADSDVFSAVAEPRRRQLLDLLASGERSVGELAQALGLSQPLVSKHLKVLRDVDAVRVRDDGVRRLYRVHGPALRPLHDWVQAYAALWSERLDRLDAVLATLTEEEDHDDPA
ncbi:metalloregulator ArsR/SmtB family transcription factor [Deinococcus sp. HMF7604]|uniref:ArsR/SmtB family transcription factor n=1 Tax=Deinococcus betulae TaxID=2873312 RepID=UPI001CCF01A8|nr:metalloregulator ArsR/SmtB family transcription factor [Deinococcus betulae]MBZ9750700.1 metalloregulator ArsR/SmtB family transcription factor [Deinococcus betulae]